jgi:hypothetical protein
MTHVKKAACGLPFFMPRLAIDGLGQHHIARQDRHQPREVAQRQSLQLQIARQRREFIEGLLSQTLIVHMIRTRRIPFVQSRAAWPLFAMDWNRVCISTVLAWNTHHIRPKVRISKIELIGPKK